MTDPTPTNVLEYQANPVIAQLQQQWQQRMQTFLQRVEGGQLDPTQDMAQGVVPMIAILHDMLIAGIGDVARYSYELFQHAGVNQDSPIVFGISTSTLEDLVSGLQPVDDFLDGLEQDSEVKPELRVQAKQMRELLDRHVAALGELELEEDEEDEEDDADEAGDYVPLLGSEGDDESEQATA